MLDMRKYLQRVSKTEPELVWGEDFPDKVTVKLEP